ncbi:unnamed protein product (mitochondrion) [Plasmodiophora brassicae]|uniref:Beta-Casp domain-containing protein n=1 Tax=Plasmodiophora brassicae TaxID=37360 RepID=A0A0G4IHG8_PLABS|nr:hypothetical protein PBRA_000447 [Plasmodiophora brassicae]SPQ93074.1 unnamed protein product [Plasmodiophora brassicae]
MDVVRAGDSLAVSFGGSTVLIGTTRAGVDADVVLLSNHVAASGLPALVLEERFSGIVYGTEPVTNFGRIYVEEMELSKGDARRYSSHDIETAFDTVHHVAFNQRIPINAALTVSASSSGFAIGACNWIFETAMDSVGFIVESSGTVRRHPTPMDPSRVHLCDHLVIGPGLRPSTCADPASALVTMCSVIETTIKQSGNVIIPVAPGAVIFDILEYVHAFLAARSLGHVTMHYISPVASASIAFSSIAGEWLCEPKQACIFDGKAPLGIEELTSKRRLQVYSSVEDDEFASSFKEPALMFTGVTSLHTGDTRFLLEQFGGDPRNCLINLQPDGISPQLPTSVGSMKVFQCPIDVRLNVEEVGQLLRQCNRCKKVYCPYEIAEAIQTSSLPSVPYRELAPFRIDVRMQYQLAYLDEPLARSIAIASQSRICAVPFRGQLRWEGCNIVIRGVDACDSLSQKRQDVYVSPTLTQLVSRLHQSGYSDATIIGSQPQDVNLEDALTVDISIPSLHAQIRTSVAKTVIHCQDDMSRLALAETLHDLLIPTDL